MPKVQKVKLALCHCGGIASIHQDYTGFYCVQCAKCGITTMSYYKSEEAISAWNKTMKERTAKVTNQIWFQPSKNTVGRWFGKCECGEMVTSFDTYCRKCGARLEW